MKQRFKECPRCKLRRLHSSNYIWAPYKGAPVCWCCSAVLGLYLRPGILPNNDCEEQLLHVLRALTTEVDKALHQVGYLLMPKYIETHGLDMEKIEESWQAVVGPQAKDITALVELIDEIHHEFYVGDED